MTFNLKQKRIFFRVRALTHRFIDLFLFKSQEIIFGLPIYTFTNNESRCGLIGCIETIEFLQMMIIS